MTQIKLVYNHLPRLVGTMRVLVAQAVRETAMQVERDAKLSMTGSKHGRLYRRGNVLHRASAPGEAPAVDTGNLINSISSGMVGPLMAEVRAGAGYAEILERRRNRRFLEPAVDGVRDWFLARIANMLGGMR